MRLRAAVCLAFAALIAAVWATGGFAMLAWWLQGQQRALQSALAGAISALRADAPAAVWSLVALCGVYGFLHALGPGHGKALIAGAAVGTRATARRMALIALLGSVAQALVAIALVYGGFALFGVTARSLTDEATRWTGPLGNVVIALMGAWILARGLRALQPAVGRTGLHGAGHAHHGHACGHDHGPSPAAAAQAVGLGATLALVAGMAARPCTGAIFVLVVAWRMGAPVAGAAGVLAMGLGTAAFTALVAWFAVTSREAALLSAGPSGAARRVGPGLQILTGGMILAIAGALLLSDIAS